MYVNQKSILNNFIGLKRDDADHNGHQEDDHMSDNDESASRNNGDENRDFQGDEDNSYSSQGHQD